MRALSSSSLAVELRDDLIRRWCEPHRRYHTREHLEHCLREIDTLAFARPAVAELAAWFHDAIYEATPGAKNERASADLATSTLAPLGVDPTPIVVMVIATERHDATYDPDTDLFLDVDMCILGQDAATFDAYEANVRAEWGWVPDDAFRAKRSELVRGWLARPEIFLTPIMRARYEGRARENLERSLTRWG